MDFRAQFAKIKTMPHAVAEAYNAVPSEKKRIFLPALGGVVFILIIITVVAIVKSAGSGAAPEFAQKEAMTQMQLQRQLHPQPIPDSELFLPDEPNFVPDVMLESESRGVWSAADAGEWWLDPKALGEEAWREVMKVTIDSALENVP